MSFGAYITKLVPTEQSMNQLNSEKELLSEVKEIKSLIKSLCKEEDEKYGSYFKDILSEVKEALSNNDYAKYNKLVESYNEEVKPIIESGYTKYPEIKQVSPFETKPSNIQNLRYVIRLLKQAIALEATPESSKVINTLVSKVEESKDLPNSEPIYPAKRVTLPGTENTSLPSDLKDLERTFEAPFSQEAILFRGVADALSNILPSSFTLPNFSPKDEGMKQELEPKEGINSLDKLEKTINAHKVSEIDSLADTIKTLVELNNEQEVLEVLKEIYLKVDQISKDYLLESLSIAGFDKRLAEFVQLTLSMREGSPSGVKQIADTKLIEQKDYQLIQATPETSQEGSIVEFLSNKQELRSEESPSKELTEQPRSFPSIEGAEVANEIAKREETQAESASQNTLSELSQSSKDSISETLDSQKKFSLNFDKSLPSDLKDLERTFEAPFSQEAILFRGVADALSNILPSSFTLPNFSPKPTKLSSAAVRDLEESQLVEESVVENSESLEENEKTEQDNNEGVAEESNKENGKEPDSESGKVVEATIYKPTSSPEAQSSYDLKSIYDDWDKDTVYEEIKELDSSFELQSNQLPMEKAAEDLVADPAQGYDPETGERIEESSTTKAVKELQEAQEQEDIEDDEVQEEQHKELIKEIKEGNSEENPLFGMLKDVFLSPSVLTAAITASLFSERGRQFWWSLLEATADLIGDSIRKLGEWLGIIDPYDERTETSDFGYTLDQAKAIASGEKEGTIGTQLYQVKDGKIVKSAPSTDLGKSLTYWDKVDIRDALAGTAIGGTLGGILGGIAGGVGGFFVGGPAGSVAGAKGLAMAGAALGSGVGYLISDTRASDKIKSNLVKQGLSEEEADSMLKVLVDRDTNLDSISDRIAEDLQKGTIKSSYSEGTMTIPGAAVYAFTSAQKFTDEKNKFVVKKGKNYPITSDYSKEDLKKMFVSSFNQNLLAGNIQAVENQGKLVYFNVAPLNRINAVIDRKATGAYGRYHHILNKEEEWKLLEEKGGMMYQAGGMGGIHKNLVKLHRQGPVFQGISNPSFKNRTSGSGLNFYQGNSIKSHVQGNIRTSDGGTLKSNYGANPNALNAVERNNPFSLGDAPKFYIGQTGWKRMKDGQKRQAVFDSIEAGIASWIKQMVDGSIKYNGKTPEEYVNTYIGGRNISQGETEEQWRKRREKAIAQFTRISGFKRGQKIYFKSAKGLNEDTLYRVSKAVAAQESSVNFKREDFDAGLKRYRSQVSRRAKPQSSKPLAQVAQEREQEVYMASVGIQDYEEPSPAIPIPAPLQKVLESQETEKAYASNNSTTNNNSTGFVTIINNNYNDNGLNIG